MLLAGVIDRKISSNVSTAANQSPKQGPQLCMRAGGGQDIIVCVCGHAYASFVALLLHGSKQWPRRDDPVCSLSICFACSPFPQA